jgi:hypothetical protein
MIIKVDNIMNHANPFKFKVRENSVLPTLPTNYGDQFYRLKLDEKILNSSKNCVSLLDYILFVYYTKFGPIFIQK